MDNRRNIQNLFDDISNLVNTQPTAERSWYDPQRRRFNNQQWHRDQYRRFTNTNTRENVFSNMRENELMDTIQSMVSSYNDNFRQYQENTLLIISCLHEMWNHVRNNNRPPRANFSYRFVPQNMTTFNQPVIVAPTSEQVTNATEEFTYNPNNPTLNSSCPISIDNFEDGEPILRILHCGHSFRPESLRRWFRTNTRCPVCRYDIREYHTNQTVSNEDNENNSNDNASQSDTASLPPSPHPFVRTNSTNSNNPIENGLVNATADIINRVLQRTLSNDGALDHVDNNLHVLSFEFPLNLEIDPSNGDVS